MLGIVVRDLGRYLADLEAAAAAGDFDAVGRSAHCLRGPSSAVLAWDTCEAAGAVEEAAHRRDANLVASAVEHLRVFHRELVRALEDFDRGGGA